MSDEYFRLPDDEPIENVLKIDLNDDIVQKDIFFLETAQKETALFPVFFSCMSLT